jgi:hypothetical protein
MLMCWLMEGINAGGGIKHGWQRHESRLLFDLITHLVSAPQCFRVAHNPERMAGAGDGHIQPPLILRESCCSKHKRLSTGARTQVLRFG